LLQTYLLVSASTVLLVHGYAAWLRLRQVVVLAMHVPTTFVAGFLAWLFVVERGAAVAQFAAGDPAREELWSLWFRSWPGLLLGLGVVGAAHCMGLLFTSLDRATWRWVPVLLLCAANSALGFCAVLSWCPTA